MARVHPRAVVDCLKPGDCDLQIFVEIERARLTKQLARLREQEGKIDEAADILQEVAVVRTKLGTPLVSTQAGWCWAFHAEVDATRLTRHPHPDGACRMPDTVLC